MDTLRSGAALAVPLLLLTTTAVPAAAHGPQRLARLNASVETPAWHDDEASGDADDPAIWVHPSNVTFVDAGFLR
ncbi:phytase [Catenuloplanes sp. NPDC051500]|uniref:phytase n=1 Tax=Catenuloplanes sp. NPDC051500 TaxID=3363959 RepID=UPI0037B01F05